MNEHDYSQIIERKKRDLRTISPNLTTDTIGPDARERLLNEVKKQPDLPFVKEVEVCIRKREFGRLPSLYQQARTLESESEERLGITYIASRLEACAGKLTQNGRRVLTTELTESLSEHINNSGLGLNIVSALFALNPNILPDNFPNLLSALKKVLGIKERIYLAKRLSELNFNIPPHWFSDTQQSPEQINTSKDKLLSGEVFLLDRKKLNAEDLEKLTAITMDRGVEILVCYDKKINLFIFIVGGTHQMDSANEYEFVTRLRKDIVLDLHTHPRNLLPDSELLHASNRDISFWNTTKPNCRHFIAIYPAKKLGSENEGPDFCEFDKDGRQISKIVNSIEISNILDKVTR